MDRHPRRWTAMRVALPLAWLLAVLAVLPLRTTTTDARGQQTAGGAARPPNIVVILADDLGYGDLAVYGHPAIRTPHLDAMAHAGFRGGAAYAPSPSCSPTRASLLTGRYAHRVGIRAPLAPRSASGLSAGAHVTLPQVLKARGYRTMLVGKWHLGDRPGMRPSDHAFDRFVGMLYSHDYKDPWVQTDERLALFDGNARRVEDPDPATLTGTYTAEAISFIRNAAAARAPFFLYVAHSMPHVPLAVSARWRGASGAGLYGDVIAELDDSVGQLRRTLSDLGLEDDTLVIFSSDNGPWNAMPDRMFSRDLVSPWDHGSTGPFRGGKGGTYEGGHRVPFLAAWPGHIERGQFSSEPISLVDLLPTLAGLAGAAAALPAGLDGIDVWPLLSGARPTLPERALLYDHLGRAEAVRVGPWKLRITTPAAGAAEQVELFHLVRDPGERHEVATAHPDVVTRLRTLLAGKAVMR